MNFDSIIVFDGDCTLCNGLVRFLIRRDKNQIFRFARLSSGYGKHLLQKTSLSAIDSDTIIYVRGNQTFICSEAILQIIKDLKGIWRFLYFLRFIPLRIRDNVYHFIARHRYQFFGKQKTCNYTEEMTNRMLD